MTVLLTFSKNIRSNFLWFQTTVLLLQTVINSFLRQTNHNLNTQLIEEFVRVDKKWFIYWWAAMYIFHKFLTVSVQWWSLLMLHKPKSNDGNHGMDIFSNVKRAVKQRVHWSETDLSNNKLNCWDRLFLMKHFHF